MHDLIIIGAGPAGLTAAVYAACYKLNQLVIGKNLGGQLTLATHIINYPGFITISGRELAEKMIEQSKKRGCQIVKDEVIEIKTAKDGFNVKTKNGRQFEAKTLILATGTERRKLNIPGEQEYTGKGVYYSAACENFIYQDKKIIIVGAGNSAFAAASQLIGTAQNITILVRSDRISAQPLLVEEVRDNPKARILLQTQVQEIKGDGRNVREVVVSQNGEINTIPADVIFVEIGGVPGTALIIPLGIKLTQNGFIDVDHKMQTSVPGIFAAGDIVGDSLSLEQLTTAVGLGARAAASVYAYLKKEKAPIVWGEAEIRRK